jgi:hypothetical protein
MSLGHICNTWEGERRRSEGNRERKRERERKKESGREREG